MRELSLTANTKKILSQSSNTCSYLKEVLNEATKNHEKVAHLNDGAILREQRVFRWKLTSIVEGHSQAIDLTKFIHEMCFHINGKISGLIKAFRADGYNDSIRTFVETTQKLNTFSPSDLLEIFSDVSLLSTLSDSALYQIIDAMSFAEAKQKAFNGSFLEKLLFSFKEAKKLHILNEFRFGELLYWMIDEYEQLEMAKGFIRFMESEGFNYTGSPAFLHNLHERLSIEGKEELGFLFMVLPLGEQD